MDRRDIPVPLALNITTLDLLLVVIFVFVVDLLFFGGYDGALLTFILGTIFVLILPGYAVVAALFPRRSEYEADTEAGGLYFGIDGVERLVLSVGLSIVIAPLLGLALNYTPFGLDPVIVVLILSLFTLGVTVIAAARRADVPLDQRFRLPIRRWKQGFQSELGRDSPIQTTKTVVVIVALLIIVSGITAAIVARPPGESFTELYILENGSDGPVANDYPHNLTIDTSDSVIVGVSNREHTTLNYTVVIVLERVRSENGSTTVVKSEEIQRVQTPELSHSQDWRQNLSFSPPMSGEDMRLTFKLYRGSVADDPAEIPPYREVYLWVDVSNQTDVQ